MSNLRRAALELAAVAVEELGDYAAGQLRRVDQMVYTHESQLPQPEEGDRLSGLYQEPGLTEEEWEAERERR